MTDTAAMTCPSCGEIRKPDEFYATSTECRPCKKQRSQQNRATAAQKVALADRLLDVLERLADQGWQPKTLLATETEQAPGSDSTATRGPGRSTRLGVNP